MDVIMRIWVLACILLFTMRQFLPQLSERIDVIGLFGIVFGLLVASAVGTSLYRRYKEELEKRTMRHQS